MRLSCEAFWFILLCTDHGARVCVCVCAVRSGNVRNIIQQFENHTETGEEGGDAADAQRLSSSSLGEDSMDRYLRPSPVFNALTCTC